MILVVLLIILSGLIEEWESRNPDLRLHLKKSDDGNKYWMLFGMRIRDMVNPVKWVSFIKGVVLDMFLQPHILEQVLVRQIVCKPCVDAGKCLDCGCKMPEKTYDLDAECSAGKWGPAEKDAILYKQNKLLYKIKLIIGYGESI